MRDVIRDPIIPSRAHTGVEQHHIAVLDKCELSRYAGRRNQVIYWRQRASPHTLNGSVVPPYLSGQGTTHFNTDSTRRKVLPGTLRNRLWIADDPRR